MVEFLTDMDVRLVRHMANDDFVVQAAQTSVKGENDPDTDMPRLINYLAEFRHGSPFEHSVFTFYVKAPIFVFREFMRHRIASYNEMSGRYRELPPEFYVPSYPRILKNSGSSARPQFEEGTTTKADYGFTNEHIVQASLAAWDHYQSLLAAGIAKEVARLVLPVNIYSQMYVTINARSLMNFLSLRNSAPGMEVAYPTNPQREIEMCAEKMEAAFAEVMPLTYAAFLKGGRVSP